MANEKRLNDANVLKKELEEENPYVHLGAFGYCACSPKTDAELVFKRKEVLQMIDSAPTVDAVEVVHGRWEWKPIQNNTWILTCSVCGSEEGTSESYNYCPKCGAKMDGDGNA